MKHPLASILLSAVVGGVTAVLALTLGAERSSSSGRVLLAEPAPSEAAEDLLRRVTELEHTNEELRLRLAAVESRPLETARAPATSSPRSAEPERDGVTRIEAERELSSPYAAGEPVSELFVAQVDAALEEIRAGEERDREALRLQVRDERIEARLRQLSEDLGLSSYQVDELRVIFQEQDDRRAELFAGMREAGDPMLVREGMRSLYEETQEELLEVMSAEQYEAYRQSSGGFGPGGFRGRDRAGDDPSGGPVPGGGPPFGGFRRRG